MTPPTRRAEAWARLVKDLPESFYAQAATEITLADAPKFADAIINGEGEVTDPGAEIYT